VAGAASQLPQWLSPRCHTITLSAFGAVLVMLEARDLRRPASWICFLLQGEGWSLLFLLGRFELSGSSKAWVVQLWWWFDPSIYPSPACNLLRETEL
jgi:hypothetical protein